MNYDIRYTVPMTPHPKVRPLSELTGLRQSLAKRGKKLVFTNGCFDLLHLGHVRYLEAAKKLGDCLVVGVNSDDSVRRLKGAGRPMISEGERAELVAALESVDFVVIFDSVTAEGIVAELQPHIYVKGGDYGDEKPLPEAKIVESYGGQVTIVPYLHGYSSTQLIEKIALHYLTVRKNIETQR